LVTGVAVLALAIPAPAIGAVPVQPVTQNIIILIDDGAGFNHHVAGSLYDTGTRDGEAYNGFPFQFAVSTYSYGDFGVGTCPPEPFGYDPALIWSTFDYAAENYPDSASTATAMATGIKTYDAAIGVDCQGTELENLVETFEALDKATGVVTSVPFSHATPAAFVAHDVHRDNAIAIASDMVNDSATDVIMGAGHPYFDQQGRAKPANYRWIGPDEWNALVAGTAGTDADGDGDADPWTLITDRTEFQALATGPTPDRVIGIPKVRRTLQADRGGSLFEAPYVVPFNENVPTLVEMTSAALNVLDDDPDGFFLMIEGGATDLVSHDTFSEGNKSGRVIEEEIAFDRTVDEVLRWVDASSNWGETLVIVASDHETGYLTGPGSGETASGPVWTPIGDNGIGVQPAMEFHADYHTSSLVPLYAKGDAARLFRRMVDGTDPIRGPYIDNTDIHTLILQASGLLPG
jgi:alkaline phosphatase